MFRKGEKKIEKLPGIEKACGCHLITPQGKQFIKIHSWLRLASFGGNFDVSGVDGNLQT